MDKRMKILYALSFMHGGMVQVWATNETNVVLSSTLLIRTVTSECTALLGQKSGVRGVSDSGFSSCTVPTYYCRSEYFYSQHPQVWNLIRTEHGLNRKENRVKNKARVISKKWRSDYGSQSNVRSDQRLSRQ